MNELHEKFGNQLRVRVCGILIQDKKILLINQKGLNASNIFWSPPGGGIEFGETIEHCLKREFLEETGLTIEIKELLQTEEFIQPPYHAIELFYHVKLQSGDLIIGQDPELKNQIITDIAWFNEKQIKSLAQDNLHASLLLGTTIRNLLSPSK